MGKSFSKKIKLYQKIILCICLFGMICLIFDSVEKYSLRNKYENTFGSFKEIVLTEKIVKNFWYNENPVKICKRNFIFVASNSSLQNIRPLTDENNNLLPCSESEINQKFFNTINILY